VTAGDQVVGERLAEVHKYQLDICLAWVAPLSKRSIIIWIWTNSELSQAPSKPGSATRNPLEDFRLSTNNFLIQLELEMTRCP
jgi:hypothetical protein